MKRLSNKDIIDNLHYVYRNDVDNCCQESFNKLRDIEEEIKLRIKDENKN